MEHVLRLGVIYGFLTQSISTLEGLSHWPEGIAGMGYTSRLAILSAISSPNPEQRLVFWIVTLDIVPEATSSNALSTVQTCEPWL